LFDAGLAGADVLLVLPVEFVHDLLDPLNHHVLQPLFQILVHEGLAQVLLRDLEFGLSLAGEAEFGGGAHEFVQV